MAIGGGAVVLVLLGAAVAVRPVARRIVEAEARERGVLLDAQEFSLSLGDVELEKVQVTLEGVQGIAVELDSVRVAWALTSPRVRRIEVKGGRVTIDGRWEEVRDRLKKFRDQHARPSGASSGGSLRRTEIVHGLDVVWHGAFEEGDEQKISGVHFERAAEGTRLGVDIATLVSHGFEAGIAGTELTWRTGEELESIKVSEVKLTARTGEVGADAATSGGPTTGAQGTPRGVGNEPTKLPGDPAQEKPRDDEDATGLLALFERNPERVESVRALLAAVREKVIPKLPLSSDVGRLTLVLERGKEKLHTGPHHLSVKRTPLGAEVRLVPGLEAKGTPLALELELSSSAERGTKFTLEGGPVALASLGVGEGDFGLVGVGVSTLAGKLEAELSADASDLTASGELSIEGLVVESSKLARVPVAFPPLALRGAARLRLDGSRTALDDVELRLGEARFVTKLAAERNESHVTLAFDVDAPLVACQVLVDSAPTGLLGAVGEMRFDGTLSLGLHVAADTQKLSAMQVRFDLKNDCKAKEVPGSLDPSRFTGPFQREVLAEGDIPVIQDFGPNSPDWTPKSEIPKAFESAMLVTEDGRFFRHAGFDERAIESSIRDNVLAGRFVRGASTISMQLAKNLYLSREKNLARKLQEAALTLLLEQSFDKASLLELYANVVELGPGIYGIRRAAKYYFDKTPSELSTMQCFFLASILPSPTDQYFDTSGKLRERRWHHLERLARIAAQRERLTKAELEAALAEQLVFGQASSARAAEGIVDPWGRTPGAPTAPERPPNAPTPPSQPTAPAPPGEPGGATPTGGGT